MNPPTIDPTHWVVTASADHAARGWAEGIVQANHGKNNPLRRALNLS